MTVATRRAASGVGAHPLGPGVTPDASKGALWRAAAAWSYAHVAAAVAGKGGGSRWKRMRILRSQRRRYL